MDPYKISQRSKVARLKLLCLGDQSLHPLSRCIENNIFIIYKYVLVGVVAQERLTKIYFVLKYILNLFHIYIQTPKSFSNEFCTILRLKCELVVTDSANKKYSNPKNRRSLELSLWDIRQEICLISLACGSFDLWYV